MAAGKIYAVRKGKIVGILDNWDACREAVEGYPGAEYKSFKTLEEARIYMTGIPYTIEPVEKKQDQRVMSPDSVRSERSLASAETLVAYVDGSYEHSLQKYAFGCVFLLPDGTIYVENGSGVNLDTAKLRNVSGEMLGAMFAVRWAIKNGFSEVELRYDYEGIEKWVTGAWKSKTELTQKYAASMRKWMEAIRISFTKVAAHTNVYYNEMADQLAKAALTDRDGIPEVRLIEEMEPWME